jgi:transposase-like protein
MALKDKQETALQLYVQNGLPCPAIAEQVGVNEGTVYRWKAKAAEEGGAFDWDVQRRAYNISPESLLAIYSRAVKGIILEIEKDPRLLLDTKYADAIAKHIKVLERLDTRIQYKGAVLDLINTANRWLAANQPDLKAGMDPYWDDIYQELVKYVTGERLLNAAN